MTKIKSAIAILSGNNLILQLTLSLWMIVLIVNKSEAQQAIDSTKSKASFTIKNLGISVDGIIDQVYGEALIDNDALEDSFIKATLNVDRISTGVNLRDKHLKQKKFFYVEQHPTIHYASNDISLFEEVYKSVGRLTIRDVTKEVEIYFKTDSGKYYGEIIINRKDYNVHNGGFLTRGVSSEVKIKFEVALAPDS